MVKIMTTNTMERTNLYWDLLETYGVANEDEIRLVCSINGYTEKAMLDILYSRTGLTSFEQLTDEDE